MVDATGLGYGGAHFLSQFIDEGTSVLGLSLIVWVIIIAVVSIVAALAFLSYRRHKRKKLVSQLQKQKQAMDRAGSDLFTERRADEIQESVRRPGKPKTVVSEGAVAYTEAGEMLVFKSSAATTDKDAVKSALEGKDGRGALLAPPTWAASYKLERVIVLHITGVAMFAVDSAGKIINGRDLESGLLIILERLMEKAKWLGGEMVTDVFNDRTVSLTWGEDIHMAAVVDGEPDERLDRELRWAIGNLIEEFADEIWSWGDDIDSSIPRTLTKRLHDVFLLTADIAPGDLASMSLGGGLRVTSTVSWRHGLIEYSLGILNNGPGPVHDIELLPILSKDGMLDVITVHGIDVDKNMRFHIEQIEQGHKAVASFVFRATKPMDVRVDCTVVYRRGVASIQKLRVPGRWIELDSIDLVKGGPVEPERAFELAMQPAAFRDRYALYIPPNMEGEHMFNSAIKILSEDFETVVELEDDDSSQLEAWFYADIVGGGNVVTSVTVVPKKGIIDLFSSSTDAGVVPGVMVLLRNSMDRTAGQHLPDVLDPEIRSTVRKMGILLFQSWGFFED